jgi:hypothetical protein
VFKSVKENMFKKNIQMVKIVREIKTKFKSKS